MCSVEAMRPPLVRATSDSSRRTEIVGGLFDRARADVGDDRPVRRPSTVAPSLDRYALPSAAAAVDAPRGIRPAIVEEKRAPLPVDAACERRGGAELLELAAVPAAPLRMRVRRRAACRATTR